MSPVLLALGGMSLFYAGWMRFLHRRATAGVLGRGAPGVRLPATKVCEHTWAAAQVVAAPAYLRLAVAFLAIGALTIVLGLAGVSEGFSLIIWLVLAIGVQVTTLSKAGRDAAMAATAVVCEHQRPPEPTRPYRPTRKARPRGKKRR